MLLASRRRCCLCFFLNNLTDARKGQIAHLNHNPSVSRFENLAWLCLEHHDEYDSTTSQSRALTLEEVKSYRDRLYATWPSQASAPVDEDETNAVLPPLVPISDYEKVRREFPNEVAFTLWRQPKTDPLPVSEQSHQGEWQMAR